MAETALGGRASSTTTAASTSAPPANCTGASVSPNAANASSTVTTGSTVARIDAAPGPTRGRPAKNRPIATTVETSARPAIQPHPAAVSARGRNSPSSADPAASETAAPVHTSADRTPGATRAASPSPTRM